MDQRRKVIFDKADQPEYYKWQSEEAPKAFERLRPLLPEEYRNKSRVGTIGPHTETGIATLEIQTMDERGYKSCQILLPTLEVDVFDLTGKKIFSGIFEAFELQLQDSDLHLFFGLKAGFTEYTQ